MDIPVGDGGTGKGPARTILIVDDEQNVCDMCRHVLEREGFVVLTAGGGRAAVEMLREKGGEIGAVLLDLTMPLMDGEEVLRQMRGVRSDVRVVVSSGHDEREAIERFAGEGPAAFIQKPYRARDLIAKLSAVIARNPPERSAGTAPTP